MSKSTFTTVSDGHTNFVFAGGTAAKGQSGSLLSRALELGVTDNAILEALGHMPGPKVAAGSLQHQPDDATLEMFRRELARPDLRIYSVVVLAERDLDAGLFDAAVARLRVDADKLRMHETPLNAWLRCP